MEAEDESSSRAQAPRDLAERPVRIRQEGVDSKQDDRRQRPVSERERVRVGDRTTERVRRYDLVLPEHAPREIDPDVPRPSFGYDVGEPPPARSDLEADPRRRAGERST